MFSVAKSRLKYICSFEWSLGQRLNGMRDKKNTSYEDFKRVQKASESYPKTKYEIDLYSDTK